MPRPLVLCCFCRLCQQAGNLSCCWQRPMKATSAGFWLLWFARMVFASLCWPALVWQPHLVAPMRCCSVTSCCSVAAAHCPTARWDLLGSVGFWYRSPACFVTPVQPLGVQVLLLSCPAAFQATLVSAVQTYDTCVTGDTSVLL